LGGNSPIARLGEREVNLPLKNTNVFGGNGRNLLGAARVEVGVRRETEPRLLSRSKKRGHGRKDNEDGKKGNPGKTKCTLQ